MSCLHRGELIRTEGLRCGHSGIEQVIEERSTPEAQEVAAGLPAGLRALLDPSDVFVMGESWDVGQLCEVRADGEWLVGTIREKIVNGDHQQAWRVDFAGRDGEVTARSGELRAPTGAKL